MTLRTKITAAPTRQNSRHSIYPVSHNLRFRTNRIWQSSVKITSRHHSPKVTLGYRQNRDKAEHDEIIRRRSLEPCLRRENLTPATNATAVSIINNVLAGSNYASQFGVQLMPGYPINIAMIKARRIIERGVLLKVISQATKYRQNKSPLPQSPRLLSSRSPCFSP